MHRPLPAYREQYKYIDGHEYEYIYNTLTITSTDPCTNKCAIGRIHFDWNLVC